MRYFSITLATLALALPGPLFSADKIAGTVEVGIKLVNALGLQDVLKQTFEESMAGIMAQTKGLNDEQLNKTLKDLMMKFYDDNYKWDKISHIYATAYATELTDAEMNAAITFYESAAGKKLRDKSNSINAEAMKVTGELMKDKTGELYRALMMAVQKRQMEKAGAGKGQ